MNYVTFDEDGNLTGSYQQDLHPDHADSHIEVSDEQRRNWVQYQANAARNGLDLIPPKQPEPPSEAEMVKHYDGIVQSHLDGVARSFGYGDPNRPEVSPILHAISYAEEPAVERFMNEGKALRAWRSLVWVTAAGILNEVKAGDRAIPTEAELLAELPPPPTQDPL